jgi:hypothetical protein
VQKVEKTNKSIRGHKSSDLTRVITRHIIIISFATSREREGEKESERETDRERENKREAADSD